MLVVNQSSQKQKMLNFRMRDLMRKYRGTDFFNLAECKKQNKLLIRLSNNIDMLYKYVCKTLYFMHVCIYVCTCVCTRILQ